jgi:predicted amidohydrolase YtcJ
MAVGDRRADGSPGPEGWRPEERITVEEAVRAYAMVAAFASGEERERGSIAPGKLADMVVLSHDLFAVAPAAILETAVEATILDGRLVYDGGSTDLPGMVKR